MDVDGKSLLSIIRNPNIFSQHDVLYFNIGNQWALRYQEGKLIYNALDIYPNDKTIKMKGYYLTNLRYDYSEKENLTQKYLDIVEKLKTLREGYIKSLAND